MSLEKALAAIAVPGASEEHTFDVGVFLTQLEREAPRQGYTAEELAGEHSPLRIDEFQRNFLIVYFKMHLSILQSEQAREDAKGGARDAGPYPQLIIDTDGDACINDGREFDLVALPARDEAGVILNPLEWAEMVRRFNDWNGVCTMLNHERDLVAELEAELSNAVSEAHATGFERNALAKRRARKGTPDAQK